MAGTSVSMFDGLSLKMRNMSTRRSDELQFWSSQGTLPAMVSRGWCLSTWQSIILLLVGLVIYDQGDHSYPRKRNFTDHVHQCYTSNERVQSPVLRSRSRSWALSSKHLIQSLTPTSNNGQVDLSAVSLSSTSMSSAHLPSRSRDSCTHIAR
jgi:hypothetical protein